MTGSRMDELWRMLMDGEKPTPRNAEEQEFITATTRDIAEIREQGLTVEFPNEMPDISRPFGDRPD